MTSPLTTNYLGLDPDTPIYRIFRLNRFWEILEGGSLFLVPPSKWEDPFEKLVENCFIRYRDDPRKRQESIADLRLPLFGQCWSAISDSDTLWRAYSYLALADRDPRRNQLKEYEGVQVRTTARKLLESLWRAAPGNQAESCFIGRVTYMSEQDALNSAAREAVRIREGGSGSGRSQAESILIKRDRFADEREVRLVYVGVDTDKKREGFSVAIDVEDVIEEVFFDHRLIEFERKEREAEARRLNYRGKVAMSGLYMGPLVEVLLDGAHPSDRPT